jgi:hypothetical protein
MPLACYKTMRMSHLATPTRSTYAPSGVATAGRPYSYWRFS